MVSALLRLLNAGGFGYAMEMIVQKAVSVAGSIHIPEKVVLVLGLLFAVAVGVFGYKYIKLVSTAVFGFAGFIIGYEVLQRANVHFALDLPKICAYLVGALALAFLAYLAFKNFVYALFGLAAVAGFVGAYLLFPNYFLAFAAAIIVAMIAMSFVRYAFVIILSAGAGWLFMGMLSALVPSVKYFSLTEGLVGKLIAIGVACIFVLIQLRTSKEGSPVSNSGSQTSLLNKVMGKKRVKIRRVFDMW
jgi:hypothetical protein